MIPLSLERVLVVDDEAIVRNDIVSTLITFGYRSAGTAGTGDEAVACAREAGPDLVLMDIGIPGTLDGIKAADIIRCELDIPVIFVTSHADDEVLNKAKLAGPYGYVVKPFTPRDLRVAIEVALSRRDVECGSAGSTSRAGFSSGEGACLDRPDDERCSSDVRSLMVEGFFDDIVLFLYHDESEKDRILSLFIGRCVDQHAGLLFAYSRSTAHRRFQQEIREGLIRTCRFKGDDPAPLERVLSSAILTDAVRSGHPFRFIIDLFTGISKDDVLNLVSRLEKIRNDGGAVGGIIAVAAFAGNDELAGVLASRIDRVVLTSGHGTAITCAGDTAPLGCLSVLPQPVVDGMVKKVLEPVILSFLDRPVSGNEIVRGIRDRYNVQVPKARVYTCLYALEKMGYLRACSTGKSRIYTSTDEGKRYIRQRLFEFNAVVHHIAAGIPGFEGGRKTGSTMKVPVRSRS